MTKHVCLRVLTGVILLQGILACDQQGKEANNQRYQNGAPATAPSQPQPPNTTDQTKTDPKAQPPEGPATSEPAPADATKSPTEGQTSSTPPKKEGEEVTQPSESPTSTIDTLIQGRWESPCYEVPNRFAPGSAYRIEKRLYDKDQKLAVTSTDFEDSNCISTLSSTVREGNFQFQEDSTKLPGSKNIVLTITKTTVTPHVAFVADFFNSVRECDQTTWKSGSPLSCNSAAFNIFSIHKLDKDQLFVGLTTTTQDGSSEEKRPSVLNLNKPYQKK